jgi:oligoendopeptidase F
MKYGSRQIMFHEAGSEKPSPILAGNQPQHVLEMIRMYRDSVNRSFFVDQIIRQEKKERQSVMEIQDVRGQMLNQLAPLLNRMEVEYLGPAIEVTFELLQRSGQLPEMPESLGDGSLEVAFSSPASQAQYATRLADLSAFMKDLAPLAQAKPELVQAIDEQKLLESYAKYRNVIPDVVKTSEELNKAKEQMAQQQQQMMTAQAAPQMTGAIKDIAQAKQIDPEGVGQLLNI